MKNPLNTDVARRHNFPLNSTGTQEILLPGVHSDLGDGYLPRAMEKVLLSKPRRSEVDIDVHATRTNSYQLAQRELVRINDLTHYSLPLRVRTWEQDYATYGKDRRKWKHVYSAVSCWLVPRAVASRSLVPICCASTPLCWSLPVCRAIAGIC